MFPNDHSTGWHTTDDETPVTVRASGAASLGAESQGQMQDISHSQASHILLKHQKREVNPASMKFSAFLGVSLVLVVIFVYFGFGSIYGDLTGGTTLGSVDVEITADGDFSPQSIEVHPGETLRFTNKNKDPQVIKSKDGHELFPVQVLFETPYEFSVPKDAAGTFTYFSETLAEEKTLTITVAAPVATAPESASSSSASEEPFDIPLPFAEDFAPVVESSSQSSSSSVPTIAIASTEHSSETATISLLGDDEDSSLKPAAPRFAAEVPTNPYTVSEGSKKQSNVAVTAPSAAQSENLHSGAPLQQMRVSRPRTITQTGPAGVLMLLLPALMGVAIVYRKFSIQ